MNHNIKTYFFIIFFLTFLLFLPASIPKTTHASSGNFTIVFPIMNVEDPQNDIDALQPLMTENDIVLFPFGNYSSVASLPNEVPGLELGTGGVSKFTLIPAMQSFPENIVYVSYDYERGWSPEWTNDFTVSMDYFKEMHNATQNAGKKFMPFPVFVLSMNWNWAEVIKNSDAVVVQVMNWQTGAEQTPDVISPESLGISLEELTDFFVEQKQSHGNNDTKIFYQFGFFQTNNTDNVLNDLNRTRVHGLDGVVVVYNIDTARETAFVDLAVELVDKFRSQPPPPPDCPGCDDDGDGIINSLDNCRYKSNPSQLDLDLDGYGDTCDIDDDGDSVISLADNCPVTYNPDQLDSDHSGTFKRLDDYRTGKFPYSVAVADFNEDGTLDIVTANSDDDTLSIILGNVGGTFGDPENFLVSDKLFNFSGGLPRSHTIDDFNGDGFLDVATANFLSNNISVLLGDFDGTFSSDKLFSTAQSPRSIKSADFNSDGFVDIITVHTGTNSTSLLMGNGDGTFSSFSSFTSGSRPTFVEVGDFNSDNNPDLVFVNPSQDSISVQLNLGNGTFSESIDYTVNVNPQINDNPREVAVGDLNLDNNVDIATVNTGSDSISILLGNGNGTFQNPIQFLTGAQPTSLIINDIDKDGFTDIGISNFESNSTSILFASSTSISYEKMDFSVQENPSALTINDFNVDGILDIATVHPNNNNTSILLGLDNRTFDSFLISETDDLPIAISSGFFNQDNIPDLITLSVTQHTISTLIGIGNGNFLEPEKFGINGFSKLNLGGFPWSVDVADFNSDGHYDVVTANRNADSISVLLGNGNGTLGSFTTFSTGNEPSDISINDVNNDGIIDIITSNRIDDNISVLLGNGDGTFTNGTEFPSGDFPSSLTTSDLNLDGNIDVITANRNENTTSILLGNGDGTFIDHVEFTTGLFPNSIVSVDFNNDSIIDVATSNLLSNSTSILLGNGNGTFSSHYEIFLNASSTAISSSDFNLDGNQDIVLINGAENSFSILLGNGDGTFQPHVDYESGGFPDSVELTSLPVGVAMGDFNADTRIDLVTVNRFSSNVSIQLGKGDGTGDACLDLDEDGILHPLDNCPNIANPTQNDTDADGLGNACDADVDGDNILNVDDNCPLAANPSQNDTDADGLGNACDADVDGDNILNVDDNCPLVSNNLQTDENLDGVGDACQVPLATPISLPFVRQNYPPSNINFNVVGGEQVTDGVQLMNIFGKSCDTGQCTPQNSMEVGFNSTTPQMTFIRNIITYNVTETGISGSQIENMTLNLSGCWHGGNDRSCSNVHNPGFSSSGGVLKFAIWNGANWELFGNQLPLGTNQNSNSDNYNTYNISKISGFSDQHLQNGLIKLLVQTGGQTEQDFDVFQVIDFAFLELTYNSSP